jgi:WD40 repeat protein
MVTGSDDKTLHLCDLKDNVILKKMDGHDNWLQAVGVSGDGRLIASGDFKGKLFVWHGDTGESLTSTINAHQKTIYSLEFSPDGAVLATGSWDKTAKLWSTKTWQEQGSPIKCSTGVFCVRFSPSGELLAIATDNGIEIWNLCTRERIAKFKAATNKAHNYSLAWTPDGTRLLSAGSTSDPTIREWDTSIWQQVGDPWSGHTNAVFALAMNSTGTLVASASHDHHLRLWRLSDRRTIAIFEHTESVFCVTFSANGKHIFSGGADMMTSEWALPDDILLEDSREQM